MLTLLKVFSFLRFIHIETKLTLLKTTEIREEIQKPLQGNSLPLIFEYFIY